MIGTKEVLLLGLCGLLAATQIGAIEEDTNAKSECLKQLENALSHLVVTEKIEEMLAVVRKHHPNTPLVEVIQPVDEVEEALNKLGYPEDCDTFLESFIIKKDQAKCMDTIEFGDSFRSLIGQNKRLDQLLGASSVCLLSAQLNE